MQAIEQLYVVIDVILKGSTVDYSISNDCKALQTTLSVKASDS